jgi:hypothetical protein
VIIKKMDWLMKCHTQVKKMRDSVTQANLATLRLLQAAYRATREGMISIITLRSYVTLWRELSLVRSHPMIHPPKSSRFLQKFLIPTR